VVGKEGVNRPVEIAYFKIDPNTGNERRDRQLAIQFQVIYGSQPTMIRVLFPPADPEVIFPQFNKRYARRGTTGVMQCKGDGGGDKGNLIGEAICDLDARAGLDVIRSADNETQCIVKCLGPKCRYQRSKPQQCRRSAELMVILPDLDASGAWQIHMGSAQSIRNINSAFDWLKAIWGTYMMIPVILMRVPQNSSHVDSNGKRQNSLHYVLQVDMPGSITKLRKTVMAITETELDALPAPGEIQADKSKKSEVKPTEAVPEAQKPEIVETACLEQRKGDTVEVNSADAKMLESGDMARFNHKRSAAECMISSIKKLYAELGRERFATILGNSGHASITEIKDLPELSEFTNILLKAKSMATAEALYGQQAA
jgi:hypothetical protein